MMAADERAAAKAKDGTDVRGEQIVNELAQVEVALNRCKKERRKTLDNYEAADIDDETAKPKRDRKLAEIGLRETELSAQRQSLRREQRENEDDLQDASDASTREAWNNPETTDTKRRELVERYIDHFDLAPGRGGSLDPNAEKRITVRWRGGYDPGNNLMVELAEKIGRERVRLETINHSNVEVDLETENMIYSYYRAKMPASKISAALHCAGPKSAPIMTPHGGEWWAERTIRVVIKRACARHEEEYEPLPRGQAALEWPRGILEQLWKMRWELNSQTEQYPSYKTIASQMNAAAWPTVNGRQWTSSVVHNCLEKAAVIFGPLPVIAKPGRPRALPEATLKLLVNRRKGGDSWGMIARSLNDSKILSREGKVWTAAGLRSVLISYDPGLLPS